MSSTSLNAIGIYCGKREEREKDPVQGGDLQSEVRRYALEDQMDENEKEREGCSLFVTRSIKQTFKPPFGTETRALKNP